MEIFAKIAEQKIREALDEGVFDDLPGSGRPLNFEDDSFVPEDLRMAYRVLRNAGCVPPELALRREATGLTDLLAGLEDEQARLKIIRRIDLILLQINEMRKRPVNLEAFPGYEERFYDKLSGSSA